ncbi:acyl-CoA dehydrogenase C-terminal domain-containing protein [Mycobacterium sp.]|uniref:acyl-CoA dehydrogenase C-terminal domain-containing protein n=1 Tax=Mycobacterium sp. TaxID=1785 RepID=UPI002C47970C|nr:acyl-CoA dehydrogenase C-terminal domain-containing protein [Mycobacterium sp.]HKP43328.1 acyl-CoA dehydrogenase C-terminal domain-containing protein [Mycobacterium sp.]
MPDYHPPVEDLAFVLNDVLAVGQFTYSGFENLDEDLVLSTIDVFGSFAAKAIGPLNAEGDRVGATLGADGVVSAPGFADAYRDFVSGGWPALTCRTEDGGDGMPGILYTIVEEMLAGANLSFAMAPLTSPGAYQVITSCASEELKARFLPKIVTGEWATAMSLTEPQCGSALGLLRTRAEPQADGSYAITGTKMFNSWGDHDMTENIVHLVLARLPDAPEGIKGISLFLVPKYLVDPDGVRGERNAFSVSSLENKLGVHASPTCVTNFEGATGYLIGTPNRGMSSMFIIMNSMRLATGACAVGVSYAAYRNALTYARERLAGRSVSGAKYPELPGDPIIVHPDVRRMLMTMRAFVEGSRALCLWVSLNLDLGEVHPDPQQRKAHEALVSLLTPVVKAFLSDKAFESTDIALQCFGGHGFIRDNGAEQYLRDVRMLRLGEGTSGIQAMDFVGRKVVTDDARVLQQYFDSIREMVRGADLPGVTAALRHALDSVVDLTEELLPRWKSDPQDMAAVSLDYLHMVGYLSLGHMWAKLAHTAIERLKGSPKNPTFLENKVRTARFYCSYLLPEIEALAVRIRAGASATMAIPDDAF